MKQLFLLSFFLISISISSQNQRFYYDYQFQTDSTDVETKMSELMVLDINKKVPNITASMFFKMTR